MQNFEALDVYLKPINLLLSKEGIAETNTLLSVKIW